MIMKSGFDSNTIQNHTGRVIRDISRLDSEKSKVCPRLHVANSFHPCICLQRTQCCIWNLPLPAVRIGSLFKSANRLDRFNQSLAIQAIPLEQYQKRNPKTEELRTWDSCHGGTLDTWNFCWFIWRASGSCRLDQNLLLEERKKVNNRVSGNRWWKSFQSNFTEWAPLWYRNRPSIINKLEKITTV